MQLGPQALRQIQETVRRVLHNGTTRTHERPAPAARGQSPSDTIGVVNDGDEDAPEGGIVAVKSVVWEKGRGPTWKVTRPTKEYQRLYAIVAQAEIKAGARGVARFAFSGPAWALAKDVPDDDADVVGGAAWGVAADSFFLKPRRPGFSAVGAVRRREAVPANPPAAERPAETRLAIEQTPPPQWIGKPTAAINARDEGMVTLWDTGAAAIGQTSKADPQSLALEVKAYALVEPVAANRWVAVTWIGGRWLVTPLECA